MAGISIYRLAVVDKMVDDIIKNRKYELRTAKIRHLMPGFGTNLAKTEAKVQDEHGNVYSYEFVLNRKLVKKFKKEPETEFLIVKLSEKKEMYSITLPPENIKNDNAFKGAALATFVVSLLSVANSLWQVAPFYYKASSCNIWI